MEVGYSPQSSWLLHWNVSSATIIEWSVYCALDCFLLPLSKRPQLWNGPILLCAHGRVWYEKAHFLRPLRTAIFLFLSAALVIDVRTAASRFWNKLFVKSQRSQKSNWCRGARRRTKKTINHDIKNPFCNLNLKFSIQYNSKLFLQGRMKFTVSKCFLKT